jgi:hypothetical protein
LPRSATRCTTRFVSIEFWKGLLETAGLFISPDRRRFSFPAEGGEVDRDVLVARRWGQPQNQQFHGIQTPSPERFLRVSNAVAFEKWWIWINQSNTHPIRPHTLHTQSGETDAARNGRTGRIRISGIGGIGRIFVSPISRRFLTTTGAAGVFHRDHFVVDVPVRRTGLAAWLCETRLLGGEVRKNQPYFVNI